jgi:hypothetical protein
MSDDRGTEPTFTSARLPRKTKIHCWDVTGIDSEDTPAPGTNLWQGEKRCALTMCCARDRLRSLAKGHASWRTAYEIKRLKCGPGRELEEVLQTPIDYR